MGIFKDSKGNVVKAGDRIKIIHNYNWSYENGKQAVVSWDEKTGMYRYALVNEKLKAAPDDFHGIHEFVLVNSNEPGAVGSHEAEKEVCPICGSDDLEYNDISGIQCRYCKQLVMPIPKKRKLIFMNKEEATQDYMNFLYWPKLKEGQTESDIEVKYTLGQAKSLAENSFKFGWDAAIKSLNSNEPRAVGSHAHHDKKT